MEEHPPLTETLVGIFVMVLIGVQTWVVINESTQGDAGRRARQWWERSARPAIVRFVIWADAHAITERMVAEEIEPVLRGNV